MPVPIEELKNTVSGWIVEQQKARTEQKAPYRWITGLVVSLVSLITLAVLAWQARRKGEELARLKHQRDLLKEQEQRARVAAQDAKTEERSKQHMELCESLKLENDRLDARITNIHLDEKTALEKIDAIKNWDEVDSYHDIHRLPTAPADDDPGPT